MCPCHGSSRKQCRDRYQQPLFLSCSLLSLFLLFFCKDRHNCNFTMTSCNPEPPIPLLNHAVVSQRASAGNGQQDLYRDENEESVELTSPSPPWLIRGSIEKDMPPASLHSSSFNSEKVRFLFYPK